MDKNLQEYYDNWLNYIKKELKDSGFDQSDYGNKLLEYLKALFEISEGQRHIMDQLFEVTKRLAENKPITVITEADFEPIDVQDGKNIVVVYVCTKYPHIYRSPNDGKYYNDRAITFVDSNGNKMWMSNGQHVSTREITLPYYLQDEYVNI